MKKSTRIQFNKWIKTHYNDKPKLTYKKLKELFKKANDKKITIHKYYIRFIIRKKYNARS